MSFVEDLEGRLEPWLTAWPESDLKLFIEAIAVMVEPLASIIEDGWTPILSPGQFPNSEEFPRPAYPRKFNPGYLGQFVGVSVPTQLAYADAISLIEEEPSFRRGTSEAIARAVARALKPGAQVRILSRQNANGEPDPDWFAVVTRGADIEGSVVTTGDVENGSATITSIPSTAGMEVGDPVVALGFPAQTTVAEVNSSTEITASTACLIWQSTYTEVEERETTYEALGGSFASYTTLEYEEVVAEAVQLTIVNQKGLAEAENNLVEAKPADLLWDLIWTRTYKEVEERYALYSGLESAFATYAYLEVSNT